MTVESQRDIQDQPYVNNDDDRDIAICQRRPLNEYQQVHNRKFTDAVSKLVNRMDSHHEKVEKQLKMFSKTIQRTTVASGLDQFRRDGEIFPDVVVSGVIAFKKILLLLIGSPSQFARSILKKLFTPAEMCESILYPNDNYAKPGLDANRMKLFKNAVCARFKISESHWNEFFNICLRRTLTQMICDVRRKTEWILNDRNSLNNDHNSLTVLYSANRYVHSRRYFEWFTS
ncbi:unnamed protein product [Rotaria socialis]|uniref:BEN domain-containing protein n=2 Tax=Rotaria TaxID=231623 RepID=A0A817Z9A2_9BILA|nr:unnamed protein product [Rotaria socialis]CAF4247512.1 unnamed protein product [Rotaria socialis]